MTEAIKLGIKSVLNQRKEYDALNYINELEKENAEMKELIEIQYAENQTLGNNNLELLKKLGTYNEQIEKMKNCRNCKNWNWKHSKCEKRLKGDCFKNSEWESQND